MDSLFSLIVTVCLLCWNWPGGGAGYGYIMEVVDIHKEEIRYNFLAVKFEVQNRSLKDNCNFFPITLQTYIFILLI